MKFLPWEKDRWNSENGSYLRYDKLEHFILGFAGLFVTWFAGLVFSAPAGFYPLTILIWLGIAALYEMYNGYIPYVGKLIEGFSWKDLMAGAAGIFAAAAVFSVLARLWFYLLDYFSGVL